MNGTSIRDKLERTLVWSATCALILFCTSELWQQAFEQYYASCGKQFLYDPSGKILMSNIFSLQSFLAETWIKNKSLPEAEALLNAYFMVYEEGWEKNETHMPQDLHWFIFKAILAVQKRWKPFSMDHHEE